MNDFGEDQIFAKATVYWTLLVAFLAMLVVLLSPGCSPLYGPDQPLPTGAGAGAVAPDNP